jgi:hypothetical protein
MNTWGSGFIPIIIYSATTPSYSQNLILTEDGLNHLATENLIQLTTE